MNDLYLYRIYRDIPGPYELAILGIIAGVCLVMAAYSATDVIRSITAIVRHRAMGRTAPSSVAVQLHREAPELNTSAAAWCAALLIFAYHGYGLKAHQTAERSRLLASSSAVEAEDARKKAAEAKQDSAMDASWKAVMMPHLDPALEAKYGKR